MANPTGRRLNQAAIILFVLAGIYIIIATQGFFDPITTQEPSWQSPPITLALDPGERKYFWLNTELPDNRFALRSNASYTSGEEDSGYGLVIDQGDLWLVIEVSPLGYVAIWEIESGEDSGQEIYSLAWQPWPHVRTSTNSNEIWVDIDGQNILVRLNREWLWEGELNGSVTGLGLIGESFEKDSTVAFEPVEVIPLKNK